MAGNTALFLSRYIKYNSIVRSFNQSDLAYRVVVNSVPKSGTHLLMKALELLPGMGRAPIQFGRQRIGLLFWCLGTCPSIRSVILSQYYAQKRALQPNGVNRIPIDTDSPFYLPDDETRKLFRLIQPGWFAMGHLPYSRSLERIIADDQGKMILIMRDPRDIVISHANYLAQKRSHYMYPLYKNLSKKERIMASIKGVSAGSNHPELLSLRERLKNTIAWMDKQLTYTTYFERLIGPQGGGSRYAQMAELRAITEHLDMEVPADCLTEVAEGLYGGTRTFRKGTSGRWRQDFDFEHKRACKELIGDLLIKLGYERDKKW